MRIFAIRMGDFVEFRSAKRPPRAKVSKLTRQGILYDEVYRYATNSYDYESFPTTTVLRTVFYLGGRVLGVMKYRKYTQLHGDKFGKRRMIELRPSRYTLLNGGMIDR